MTGDSSTATLADLDAGHAAATLVGAVLLGLYAAWMTADLLARWLVVPLVAVAAGYALARRPTTRGKAIYVCAVLAALLALTPVTIVLPNVLSAGAYGASPWSLALTTGNLFLVVLFAVPAALVAYVGYRLAGGRGVRARIRAVRSG